MGFKENSFDSDPKERETDTKSRSVDPKQNRYEMGSCTEFQSKDPIFTIAVSEKSPQNGEPAGHLLPVEHPTSYAETMMHLFKGNVGSGLFAMGDAFKNAGMVFGPVMTLVLGFVCVHSQHILLNASTELTRRTKREIAPDYAETVELCIANADNPSIRRWAKAAKRFVNVFLCITQFGFCCVYFVFISSNIKQVSDYNGFVLDVHLWMTIILPPILLSCMIRNLKYLAPFSMFANVLIIIGIVATLYFACQDLPSPSTRPPIAPWSQIPLFFGTAIYSFEGIGLVLPLKNEMRHPRKFDSRFGVLNVGMVVVSSLLTGIGFIGYLKYGEEVGGSITLNLPEDSVLAQTVKIIICVSVMFSFALQFYIPIDIMWPSIESKFGPFRSPVFMELSFRALFVLVTFTIAQSIPALELLISLIGAVSSTALALFIPPVLELVIRDENSNTRRLTVLKDWAIILFAFVGFATGTYASIGAIVHELSH